MQNKIHLVVVSGFNSGLNELLQNQNKQYNHRTRKMHVYNNEKSKNDKFIKKIIMAQHPNLKIKNPLYMHYKFYVCDMKHDYSNIESAFIKSFEDALQAVKCISNDGAKDIVGKTMEYELDRTLKHHVVLVAMEELPRGTIKVPDIFDWNIFKQE